MTTVTFPGIALKSLLMLTSSQLALGGNGALRSGLPTQPAPLVSSPTIALNTAVPGTTPTNISPVANSAPNTNAYTFSGGEYIVPSNTYPYYTGVGIAQLPNATLGFSNCFTDFESDAPIVTFNHTRGGSAVIRVLCDNYDGKGLVELFRIENGIRAGTAQAGSASTITLDSGASATNGLYFNNWVHITGGTGAGQYAQITGYVGSTKVATISSAWSTQPDNTSTFELTYTKAAYTNLTNTGVSNYYMTVTWGERRSRHYRIEQQGDVFFGVYVTSSIDTVAPTVKSNATPCIWVGDSFAAGTGAGMGLSGALARVACDQLGWDLISLSIGGTGVLNPSSGTGLSFTTAQRLLPPPNAWFVQYNGATAGSLTLTQSGITVTVNYNDTLATIQSSFNAAFGAGTFSVVLGEAATQRNMWVMGLGSTSLLTTAMTANFSGLTGATTAEINQYLGDIAIHAPVDGQGNALPFNLVLSTGHNDTADSNAAYTPSVIKAAYSALIAGLVAKYPKMTMFVVGNMYLPGGSATANVTACDAAILAACNASLPTINGTVPFIETLSPAWFTGTGYVGALAGNGNSDVCCFTDGVHPTDSGHETYGFRLARSFMNLLGI